MNFRVGDIVRRRDDGQGPRAVVPAGIIGTVSRISKDCGHTIVHVVWPQPSGLYTYVDDQIRKALALADTVEDLPSTSKLVEGDRATGVTREGPQRTEPRITGASKLLNNSVSRALYMRQSLDLAAEESLRIQDERRIIETEKYLQADELNPNRRAESSWKEAWTREVSRRLREREEATRLSVQGELDVDD